MSAAWGAETRRREVGYVDRAGVAQACECGGCCPVCGCCLANPRHPESCARRAIARRALGSAEIPPATSAAQPIATRQDRGQ